MAYARRLRRDRRRVGDLMALTSWAMPRNTAATPSSHTYGSLAGIMDIRTSIRFQGDVGFVHRAALWVPSGGRPTSVGQFRAAPFVAARARVLFVGVLTRRFVFLTAPALARRFAASFFRRSS
jgi:hypothetical protein